MSFNAQLTKHLVSALTLLLCMTVFACNGDPVRTVDPSLEQSGDLAGIGEVGGLCGATSPCEAGLQCSPDGVCCTPVEGRADCYSSPSLSFACGGEGEICCPNLSSPFTTPGINPA